MEIEAELVGIPQRHPYAFLTEGVRIKAIYLIIIMASKRQKADNKEFGTPSRMRVVADSLDIFICYMQMCPVGPIAAPIRPIGLQDSGAL